jgi:hypothetical protein
MAAISFFGVPGPIFGRPKESGAERGCRSERGTKYGVMPSSFFFGFGREAATDEVILPDSLATFAVSPDETECQ